MLALGLRVTISKGVALMEQIEHKQIPVHAGKTPEGRTFTHFGEYGEMLDRLESYHRHCSGL